METKELLIPSVSLIAKRIYTCPVEATIDFIGGKWKAIILHHLSTEGTLRFGELKRRCPGVTQKMLTSQLRELESDLLVNRVVYAVVPPKVEYSLSTLGETLIPILHAMRTWSETYVAEYTTSR